MRHFFYSKLFALVLIGLCASCSSSGQSVQNTADGEIMGIPALIVGIESADTPTIVFYVVNNTTSDIRMLTWNTPFEKILSADLFLVTHAGKDMPYLGRKVKRGNPGADDYLLIPAGKKLESAMDIGKYYGLVGLDVFTVAIKLPLEDGLSRLNQETAVAIETGTLTVGATTVGATSVGATTVGATR